MAMRIALLIDRQRQGTTGMYLERACRQLGVVADSWSIQDVGRIPATYDLYLRVDHGDDYEVNLPDHLRPSVFYAIDTHLPHSWRKIKRLATRVERVYCAQRAAATRLPHGVWLPLACDPTVHGCSPEPLTVQWDVAFVGTSGGVPRKFYLQALRERYPKSLIGSADYRDMAARYGQARIGFNYAIADDVNMRVFEVLAAGALLVTNVLAHEDLATLGLKDHEQMILYRHPSELFERIEYFLTHHDERQEVATAGHRLVMKRHTYVDRLRQLLVDVERHLGVRVPVLPQLQESHACEC